LTLFGDAVLHDGDSFGDIESGYGVEAKLLPGLALAAKARSTGEVSLRLGVALSPQSELGFRPHLDDGGDRVASTYTLEFGPPTAPHPELQRDKARRFPAIALKGRLAYQRFWLFDERPTLLGRSPRSSASPTIPPRPAWSST